MSWIIIHMAVDQQKDFKADLLELGFGLINKNVCIINTKELIRARAQQRPDLMTVRPDDISVLIDVNLGLVWPTGPNAKSNRVLLDSGSSKSGSNQTH